MVQEEIVRRENERRNQSDLTSPPVSDTYAGTPFYVHNTRTCNRLALYNTLIFGRMFQEVVMLAEEGKLGNDHQSLSILFDKFMRVGFDQQNLKLVPMLYEEKTTRWNPFKVKDPEMESQHGLGLGIKRMMRESGYGYIDPDLIDIIQLNFTSNEIADAFPHPTQARKGSKKEPLRQLLARDFLQEIDTMLGRIPGERDLEIQDLLLAWLAMRIVEQFHEDMKTRLLRSPLQFHNKEKYVNMNDVGVEDDDDERSDGKLIRIDVNPVDCSQDLNHDEMDLNHEEERAENEDPCDEDERELDDDDDSEYQCSIIMEVLDVILVTTNA